jgi:Leucine Rich Repeat (LRR) protein
METRKLHFPSPHSVGTLSVRTPESEEDWSFYAEAMGAVILPPNKEVRLEVLSTVVLEPSFFATFDPEIFSVIEWVGSRHITDGATISLQCLFGLKGLALWETHIGDLTLGTLRRLSNLRWLDIGDTRITDHGLRYVRELTSLQELSLLNDNISVNGISHFHGLTSLKNLDLMNTPLTDDGVETLCRMHHLKSLRIIGTRISQEGYARLKDAMPDCRIQYYHPTTLPGEDS